MELEQAFVFPGQGGQTVGMGRELCEAYPAARYVFQEVDDALGESLSTLMFEGPDEALTRTDNAQPALLTVSLAVVRVLEERLGTPLTDQATFLAGHSLGEYSALTAAGALSLADAVRLVRARGRAIQAAAPPELGSMAAIVGLDVEAVRAIAADSAGAADVCQLAADNAPDEQVVSGHRHAVERAAVLARERGARSVVPVRVSAPFHCSLLASVAPELERLLAGVEIVEPPIPVVANVTATPQRMPDPIRRRLVEQLTAPVRWRETMEFLTDRTVGRLVELGPGTTLARLARRNQPEMTTHSVGTPGDLEAYMGALMPSAG